VTSFSPEKKLNINFRSITIGRGVAIMKKKKKRMLRDTKVVTAREKKAKALPPVKKRYYRSEAVLLKSPPTQILSQSKNSEKLKKFNDWTRIMGGRAF
jgi:hypothetical protein